MTTSDDVPIIMHLREAAKVAYTRVIGPRSITDRSVGTEACLVAVCYKACLEALDAAQLGRTGLGVAVVWTRDNGATVVVRYDGAEVSIAPPGARN
jgi:hypothetical protein